MKKSDQLLLEIARCDNFINCKNCECEKIVNSQKQAEKQIPEPWNGDIENSKILFISSNPSINLNEVYPLASWNDNDIIDFFYNRFSESKKYVKGYLYPQEVNGYAENWVRYWAYVRSIARKLLEKKNVTPGTDHTLMETVRCKSLKEYGVVEAIDTCTEKYLSRTLEISKAKVIIVVGDKARDILSEKLNIKFKENFHTEQIIGGLNRIIFATPHSNARKKRQVEDILSKESICHIKEFLKLT